MRAISRRQLLQVSTACATAGVTWAPGHAAPEDAEAVLRTGGVIAAFRHALAPGTFDPPGFRLGDCSTQRNLDEAGRAQARRIGAWFAARSLRPARVRSSPWCRCVDTATLAFGQAEIHPALGSPSGSAAADNARARQALLQMAAAAAAQPGRFEVWVTHMFVLADLTGEGSASGEGLVLQADRSGTLRVRARLPTI